MLQQTQVETVKAYYEKFIQRYPRLEDLANADEADVLKQWEGLGYYSRARNLQAAMQTVRDQHKGVVPADPEVFGQLKGVGPYTKGAVMSIAYGLKVPAVDGNVFRVWSRLNQITDDISKASTRKRFEAEVLAMMPDGQASHYNQALMEIGALICRPKQAQCLSCPLQSHCQAFAAGDVTAYPVKAKKVKNKPLYYQVYVLQDNQGRLLMQQRPETGLLAKMWEFPMYEAEVSLARLEEDYQLETLGTAVPLMQLKHVFTHLTWFLEVYVVQVSKASLSDTYQWLHPKDLQRYSVAVPVQKIIQQLLA